MHTPLLCGHTKHSILMHALVRYVFMFFSPIYDAFHCGNFTNPHYSRLENPHLIIVCRAAVCCCVLCFIYLYRCIFLVGVHTNIANIITNILITNIIIQIPEGNYLTCTPPLPSSLLPPPLLQILLSLSRVQEAKTFSLAHSGRGR